MFFDKQRFLGALNKGKAERDSLLEYSFGELKSLSDPARRSRSKAITTFFKGLEQGSDGQARTLWEVPSQSRSGVNYRVIVEIAVPKIGLFGIAKQKWDAAKFTSIMKEADVKVHCTCPDFYWAGPKYNLGPSGFLKGSVVPGMNAGHKGPGYSEKTVVTEPPEITDPDRQHVLCKHCIAVSTNFAANALSIMKAARNFAVKIKINDQMMRDGDSGKVPLKKDVDFIDMNDDESKKITEAIIHGAEQVSEEESTLTKNISEPDRKDTESEAPASQDSSGVREQSTPEIANLDIPREEVKKDVAGTELLEPSNTPSEEPVDDIPTEEPPQKIDSSLNPVPQTVENDQIQKEKDNRTPNDILDKSDETTDQENKAVKPIQ